MIQGSNFDIIKWSKTHGPAETRPLLDSVVAALKADDGVATFGAVGYCFGGRYVFDLAFEKITAVSVSVHPALLEAPADYEVPASSFVMDAIDLMLHRNTWRARRRRC